MDQITLINILGGNSVVARKLGIGQSAVANWRKDGIPTSIHHKLYLMAKQTGVILPDDFFAEHDAPRKECTS